MGESNIDRAIGDLMTERNPTVGLAAHAGQTDVRVTAKADTEAEADALIAPIEAEIRKRLGVAIYGTGRETVAEVVGNLLRGKGVTLGVVVDALTGGQVVREFEENGAGQVVITAQLQGDDSPTDPRARASTLAKAVAPKGGMGLAMLGPYEDQTTFMAVYGPGSNAPTCVESRRFQDSDHIRRWLVIQAMDLVRRAILGDLASPAD